jgi:hypothetical protein
MRKVAAPRFDRGTSGFHIVSMGPARYTSCAMLLDKFVFFYVIIILSPRSNINTDNKQTMKMKAFAIFILWTARLTELLLYYYTVLE